MLLQNRLGQKACGNAAQPRRQRQCFALPRAVSAVVVESIVSEANKAKEAELQRRFQMADADGNGMIDREELRRLLESTQSGEAFMFEGGWLPESEVDAVMQAYDKDGNGLLDFAEFSSIVYDGLLLDGKLSEYEEAFKAFDTTGNGTIGATELAAVFAQLGNPMSYEELVEVMQKYDKDESGQIEFPEFLLMFRNHLLDLKQVKEIMGRSVASPSGTPHLLDAPEGDIALIFSEQELDEALESAHKAGKALVVFNALTWCRPCKGMQRATQRMAAHYKDSTMWVKIFGNANNQTKSIFMNRLKIRSTPHFAVFNGKEVVYTQTGTNKPNLEKGIREALGASKLPQDWVYPPEEEQA